MSWITIIWSMEAAVCLTLAAIYFTVWLQARKVWGHLFFTFSAVAAASVAAGEFVLLRTESVERYGSVMWLAHIPLWVLVVSVVWFTRFHLRAGQPWLGWAVTTTRTLAMVVNFFSSPNLNFKPLTGLHHMSFLGESISIPEGVVNPWSYIGKLSSVLLLMFLVSAILELWRRREKRVDLFLIGSMVLFITAAALHSALVERSLVQSPYVISFAYLGVVLIMAYGLSSDVLRASQLVIELQASEAGLRESEARMTLAAEAANLGIWISDLVQQKIWASDRWRAIFGFDKSEWLDFGKILRRMLPEDCEDVNRMLTSVLADGGSYDTEYRLLLPDGEIRWIASRGRVEFNDNGNPTLLRGVSVDVTERHIAELKLQQQRTELAHFSRVSMLGELSGSLAHELSQPLGAILRNTEAAELFLQEPSPDLDELRAILVDIRNDDQRARAVIDRMRSMMKRREVEHTLLDMNILAGEVISLVRRDADLRKVHLGLEPASSLPPMRGDRIQLQQVLLNLLLNAMDAVNDSLPDRRRITIRVQLADKQIEVAVTDAGPGIPEEKLAHVFEPFFTSKENGMGLGLPISRTIIEAHGGSIRAHNHTDGGATFCVTLPVVQVGIES
jgi:PAS domain S-box-containing protein